MPLQLFWFVFRCVLLTLTHVFQVQPVVAAGAVQRDVQRLLPGAIAQRAAHAGEVDRTVSRGGRRRRRRAGRRPGRRRRRQRRRCRRVQRFGRRSAVPGRVPARVVGGGGQDAGPAAAAAGPARPRPAGAGGAARLGAAPAQRQPVDAPLLALTVLAAPSQPIRYPQHTTSFTSIFCLFSITFFFFIALDQLQSNGTKQKRFQY